MKFSLLTSSWRHAAMSNKILLSTNVFLAITVMILGFASLTRTTIVTVVPPKITSSVTIRQNNASSSYYEAWALSISELLGHATTINIGFVKKALSLYFDPDLYTSITSQLELEISTMEKEGYRISFAPLSVTSESSTGKIFVTGNLVTTFRDGGSSKMVRTYEYRFKTVNYNPIIIGFDVYKDGARTREELARLSALPTNTNKGAR